MNALADGVSPFMLGDKARMTVEFHPTHVRSEERNTGADFGIRFHISHPDYNVSKGILFQSKRIYQTGSTQTFDELRDRGEQQAEKMLGITPSSFFLLYNGLKTSTVHEWLKPSLSWLPYLILLTEAPDDEPSDLQFLNTGVMVLPASRVHAESRACRRGNKLLPVDARHWIEGAVPLGIFMAELIGPCFVGDVRDAVLGLVTPPKIRQRVNDGVPEFDPSFFPIANLINIDIESTGALNDSDFDRSIE